MAQKHLSPHIESETMHNVIVEMISDSIEDIRNSDKLDKDKLDILSGLIFEHIFHRTHIFVSDELDEFRAHSPRLDSHQKYIEWSLPIVTSSGKIIKKLKQIGVIFSVLFTIAVGINQIYGVVKNYYSFDISVTEVAKFNKQVKEKVKEDMNKNSDAIVDEVVNIKDTK